MTNAAHPRPISAVSTGHLRPFASFGILEYTGTDASKAVPQVIDRLLKSCLNRRSGAPALVAQGLADGWAGNFASPNGSPVVGDAFVYTYVRVPPWATSASPYAETVVDLVVVLRIGQLVAVACPPDRVQSLQFWINDTGKASFRRVPPIVLEHALLSGEAKGLWLRGVHPRQKRKPDAKNITGTDLRETLDPLGDGSFVLSAGRAAAPDDPRLVHTSGSVGVSPKKSWVWNRQTNTFDEFVHIVVEVLDLVEEEMKAPHSESVFTDLATAVESLDGVHDAYDAYFADPEDVAMLPDSSVERVAFAEVLRGTVIEVIPRKKAKLVASVGDNGAEAGKLLCSPALVDGSVVWDFRTEGTPSDPVRFAQIREAAEAAQILNVFYESHHAINFDAISMRRLSHMPFRGWRFEDFTGYSVDQEKPGGSTAEDIHKAIASTGDTSIFGWVASRYSSGHLTCDDGSNEVADFVHLAPDNTLSLIHVKAATSSGAGRLCSTGAFELVAGQAGKNARYLNVSELIRRLEASTLANPATWYNGRREVSRLKMIRALKKRPVTANSSVVIVQPHHHRSAHDKAVKQIALASPNQDGRRLMLIETLLNTARGAIAAQGADLDVIASH